MPGVYLIALLVSFAGMLTLDARYRLALWAAPVPSALAIVIAQTVLGNIEMSLPAAVYGVLMFFVAAAFGFLIRGRGAKKVDAAASV